MSKQRENSGEEICRQLYTDTKYFYRKISKGRKDDPGFQILYGPPFFHAPVLFIGYQPGKGCKTALEERAYGAEDRWPPKSEYATECWPLAKRLREMLGKEFIEKCVGTNAIFVRANSIADYENVSRGLRTEIEEFCRTQIKEMVGAIEPKLIVAIGFATLDLFGGGGAGGTGDRGRVLTKTGKIFGRDALGVLHLSGALISKRDREIIACHIRSRGLAHPWAAGADFQAKRGDQ